MRLRLGWLSAVVLASAVGCGASEPTGAPAPTRADADKLGGKDARGKEVGSPEGRKWKDMTNWERNPDKSQHPPP